MSRWILHADLDAFYASVEQLDRPELRGKPVVVGGAPEQRGVVAAASYEARRFGVRSAMPMSRALRLCPDAARLPPRFDRYAELSRQVMAVFRDVTPLVEPLSFDEAFLDVSATVHDAGEAERLARDLKRRVKETTGLTLSVGAGTSKSVAKIASDQRKPDGLVVVAAGDEAAFLAPLPVRALWGVGPKTEERLRRAGVHTIGDLARRSDADAERLVGSWGVMVRDMARGVDERPVIVEHERKSVGSETTFARDLPDGPELRDALREIAAHTGERLRRSGARAHTVAIKLRYAHFKTITRQTSLKDAIDDDATIAAVAGRLLDAVVAEGDRFRLLGIQCSRLVTEDGKVVRQGRLWSDEAAASTGRTPC